MSIRFLLILFASSFTFSALASVPTIKHGTFPEGEGLIYTRLEQSFRKGDLLDVMKQQRLLSRNYPDSVHLPSAYYFLGALDFQQNRFGDALTAFDQVINRFPLSGKRSSALFAMGKTYQKLNLTHQATAVFDRIVDLYPGSPDAARAALELRLITKNSKVTE